MEALTPVWEKCWNLQRLELTQLILDSKLPTEELRKTEEKVNEMWRALRILEEGNHRRITHLPESTWRGGAELGDKVALLKNWSASLLYIGVLYWPRPIHTSEERAELWTAVKKCPNLIDVIVINASGNDAEFKDGDGASLHILEGKFKLEMFGVRLGFEWMKKVPKLDSLLHQALTNWRKSLEDAKVVPPKKFHVMIGEHNDVGVAKGELEIHPFVTSMTCIGESSLYLQC